MTFSPSRNTGTRRGRANSYQDAIRAQSPATPPSSQGAPGTAPDGTGSAEGAGPSRPSRLELIERYEKLRAAIADEPAVAGHRLLLADTCIALDRTEEAAAILLRAIEDIPACRERAIEILRSFLPPHEVEKLPIRPPSVPFWNDAAAVLRYPLRGNGPILLAGGGIIFSFLALLARSTSIFFWLPFLLGAGYLASYMLTIIESSGRGEREPPDYPDFTNFWDSILGPFWVAVSASAIPAAPAIAYWTAFGADPILLAILLVGLAYWPMALVAGAIFGSAAPPMNFPLVVRAIRVTAREYFPALATIAGLAFADGLLERLTASVLPGLFSIFISQVVGLYFLMVEMDILGRIYYNHDRAIGWFERRKRRSPGAPK